MQPPLIKQLGLRPYEETFEAMRALTQAREPETADEIWLLEHPRVFTQGQAGKPEHLLMPGDIPVVQSDRGGQVTYHGPGQLVGYFMLDLERLGYGIRSLVTRLENAIIASLAAQNIRASSRRDAPGVYVDGSFDGAQDGAKIASLGLRVRKGRTYHGIAINVNMDLEPFSRINPCGYQGMAMTQTSALGGVSTVQEMTRLLVPQLLQQLGYG